ncbi:hypothetical protein HZB60_12020 [candidate division KSB1 bacterium]|nr:hypothetical protein [candidate division KSB1 bacterium]
MRTIVDERYAEYRDLLQLLVEANQPSLRNSAEDGLRKMLLLIAASYLEEQLCRELLQFYADVSGSNAGAVEFVRTKAITRQFHSYFNWDSSNANQFFGLFGKDFAEGMKAAVAQDGALQATVKAFLEIGRERNKMIHRDLGSFVFEKTTDEIFQLFDTARHFVPKFSEKLRALDQLAE